MTNSNITVVVLSRYWPTALSVIRSLGAASYTVDLVASSPQPGGSLIAASSKYIRNAVESVQKRVKESDDPGIMDNLKKYENSDETIILFPTDDYTSSWIDRNRAALEGRFILPKAERPITTLMEKSVQAGYAKAAGLCIPQGWTISLKEEIEIPPEMVYPCFVKPLESFSGFKGEMKKCNDCKELYNHLEFLKQRNPERSIMVQEFLNIDSEIDIQGVCNGDSVVIPGMIRKTGIAKLERGVTMAGYMAPLEELGPIAENVKKLLISLGYRGIFDMELNLVGDKVYFGEINLRSGGPNYAYFLSGVNLPDIAVKCLLDKGVSEEETSIHKFGKTFAYEKVIWKEFTTGNLSKSERDKMLNSADGLLIGSSDDEKPTELFLEEVKREIRNSKKKNIKKDLKSIGRPVYKAVTETLKGYPQRKPGNRRKAIAAGERPRAMVVGRNYCSNLCMARSLGMAGYDVEILRIMNSKKTRTKSNSIIPEAYSKYVKAFYTCTRGTDGINVADTLVKCAYPESKMVLFPTEDVAAYIVDQYYNRLKKYYYLPNIDNKQGKIIEYMSKDIQKSLAEKVGLKTVDGCSITIENGKYTLPQGIKYPCFIKPDVSRMTSKTRMKRCDSKTELIRALDEIAESRDLNVIVEDFIQIKREISLLGLSAGDFVTCPGCFEVLMGGNGARRGVSVKGRIISTNQVSSIMPSVIAYVKALNYTGLFDIDLLEDENGDLYFIEINLRYGASGYVLTRCGVNLPGILADNMSLGTPLEEENQESVYGATFISEKVIVEEYSDGFISAKTAISMIAAADVPFIKCKEDPKPYRTVIKLLK